MTCQNGLIKCSNDLVIYPAYFKVEDERLQLNVEEKEAPQPWGISHIGQDMCIVIPVLNSDGDLVSIFTDKDYEHVIGKLNTTSGKFQLFFLSIDVTSENIEYCSVSVDDEDQVCVLSLHDSGYKLSVYAKNGILRYHCRLTFLKVCGLCYLAVTNEKNIVICCENDFGEIIVYLCKTCDDQPRQSEESSTRSTSHSAPPQSEESSTRSAGHSPPPQNVESSTRFTSHSPTPQNEESSTRSASHSAPPENEESSMRSTSHSVPLQNNESSKRSTSHSAPPQNEEYALSVVVYSTFSIILMAFSTKCLISCTSNHEIVIFAKITSEVHVLHIYTEDGQLKKCVEFRARKGNYYMSLCYHQTSHSIAGLTVEENKVFVEFLSGDTGELLRSHLLFISEVVESPASFCLVSHRNGALALVGRRSVLMLQTSERAIMP